MARSSYIYVVRHKQQQRIINSWTVKHELVRWLEALKESWQKRGMSLANLPNVYEVVRMRDGRNDSGVIPPLEDFIELPDFNAHLERASETVRSWPSWKQNVLGDYYDLDHG